MNKLPFKSLLLVLGLVATAYALALLFFGQGAQTSLDHLWSWTGVQAAGLCLLNYLLRGLRWRRWMEHYGRRFGLAQGLRLYLAGYAFTPTPGNVGESLRGVMLRHQPLRATQSMAIFGAERLADLVCLLLLCVPVVGWVLQQGLVQAVPGRVLAIVAVALTVAVLAILILLTVWVRRGAMFAARFMWLQEAWHCLRQQPGIWLALTLCAWVSQGLAVWLLCRALAVPLDMLTATGFYAAAMVAGALSALPAGLGGTEAVLAGLLIANGASAGQAMSVTVLARLLTLWLAVALGLLALLYSAAIQKDISFR